MRHWRFTGLVVSSVAVLWLVGWMVYVPIRDKVDRDLTTSHLKQIGLALHSYHEQWRCFPPAYIPGPDGTPWHSWRVLLLPHLGEASLYSKYHFDEPWNGPHNRELLRQRPVVYESSLQASPEPFVTTYVGVVSRRTMWPAQHCMTLPTVIDGASNTIHVIEHAASDIAWLEPRDLREHAALQLLRRPETSSNIVSSRELLGVLFVDGSVRTTTPLINRELFVSLLTPRFQQLSIANADWPLELGDSGRGEMPPFPHLAEAATLSNTRVSSHAFGEIVAGRTTLYCATSQLAWDQLRPELDQPLICSSAAIADLMNRQPFPREALAPDCYFASGERMGSASEQELLKELQRRFPLAPMQLLPTKERSGMRILIYIEKTLPFIDVLDVHDKPLRFQSDSDQRLVQSFGRRSYTGEGADLPVVKETVTVGDYVSDRDFILQFHADTPKLDEVVIGLVPPAETLQTTWKHVEARLKSPQGTELVTHLRAVDLLQVPVMACSIGTPLTELIGLKLPTQQWPDRWIADARETIRFRLDEFGAELIADTHMVVADNGHGPELIVRPLTPRRFVCDRPFLLALREQNAAAPYFLAWIGNADLLLPTGPQ